MKLKYQARSIAASYPVTVRWSEEDHAFVATVHDLTGDCCHGDDPVKVFAEAREIALECVTASLRDNIPLNIPSLIKTS